jgi:hypothetical protein
MLAHRHAELSLVTGDRGAKDVYTLGALVVRLEK